MEMYLAFQRYDPRSPSSHCIQVAPRSQDFYILLKRLHAYEFRQRLHNPPLSSRTMTTTVGSLALRGWCLHLSFPGSQCHYIELEYPGNRTKKFPKNSVGGLNLSSDPGSRHHTADPCGYLSWTELKYKKKKLKEGRKGELIVLGGFSECVFVLNSK